MFPKSTPTPQRYEILPGNSGNKRDFIQLRQLPWRLYAVNNEVYDVSETCLLKTFRSSPRQIKWFSPTPSQRGNEHANLLELISGDYINTEAAWEMMSYASGVEQHSRCQAQTGHAVTYPMAMLPPRLDAVAASI